MTERFVHFKISHTAVGALALDDRAKWPKTSITAYAKQTQVITTPDEARMMLDECKSRSPRGGGEGWDQPASWGRACAVAAAQIALAIREQTPRE